MSTESPCRVHKHHDNPPIDIHHIWPKSEGGPDKDWNRIAVCPNGHRDIHAYLRLLVKGNGKVPWIKGRLIGRNSRKFALLGYQWLTERPEH